jgi:hypothetical protein
VRARQARHPWAATPRGWAVSASWRMYATAVLDQVAAVHLGEAEDALDDPDGVLHAGAHLGALAVDGALQRAQVLVAAAPALGKVHRGSAHQNGLHASSSCVKAPSRRAAADALA